MARRTSAPTAPDARREPGDRDGRPTARRPRRNELIAGGLALLLLLTGAMGWYLTRGAKEVTVDQALENYRAGATDASAPPKATTVPETTEAPAASAPVQADRAPAAGQSAPGASAAPAAPNAPAQQGLAVPPPGVYTYKTQGHEETDALSGARHDYPAETAITNRKAGCSWISRWQPLRERWDESEFCEKADGTQMKTFTMYHEFFQRGVTERFECNNGYVMFASMKPGQTWSFNCASKNTKITSKNTFIGNENVTVGGKTLSAARIRYEITATGDNEGKLVQERWLVVKPRTLVRVTQTATLKVMTPFGSKANYTENYKVDLKSLEPKT